MRPALDPVWPLGPSSPFYLSLHSLEATQAKTFRTRSSPVPMQIKLQPAPAILGQESVHTTLSIIHHTKERPSTCPRTLQSLSWSNFYLKLTVKNRDLTTVNNVVGAWCCWGANTSRCGGAIGAGCCCGADGGD
jgi:hypothetical protein